MMSEYLGIAVCFALAGAITGAMVLLASTLGKKKPSPVKSEPFEDDEPIWEHHREDETFPHRVEINSNVVLAESQFVDAREVGPGLEYVRKWPPEDWPLAFIGPLHIIPQRDFTYLEEEMKRAGARSKSSRKRRGRRGRGNRDPKNGKKSSANGDRP